MRPIRASVIGPVISIRSPFGYKDYIKALPGACWNPMARRWELPATPTAATALVRAFGDDLEHGDDFDALLAPRREAEVPDKIAGLTTPLWDHQRRALARALSRGKGSMLDMEMGTGKSLAALAYALSVDAQRILIVCPKSVVGVWPREIASHCSETWEVARCDKGSVSRRAELAYATLDRARVLRRRCAVVVNHEAVWQPRFAELCADAQFDLLIVDESHRAKAPGGRLSRFLAKLAATTPRRLALTGTPLPHSPLDAYAQFRFLDTSVYGTSFVRFRGRYAVMGGFQRHQVVGWQRMDEFEERFRAVAFRVRKEDVLDLPEEMDETRLCELEPEARKTYTKLEADFYTQVKAKEVTASNALTKLLRLQQIASGTLKTDDGSLVRVSEAKAGLLADVLSDLPEREPVIVFARFLADLDAIAAVTEKLGRRYGEVSGRRKDLTPEARMPNDVDILGVQIQAGGVGIDLTRACLAIYYSHGWSLGDLLQSRSRLHRPGQTRPVTYVHLVAENTLDERIIGGLRRREELIESVLKDAGDS